MKNGMKTLFFIFTLVLLGCGRPKDYKEQAVLSFQGAHAGLAKNNFKYGVLIIGKWDAYPNNIYRFWVKPGVDKVQTLNVYVPTGKVRFYGIGASDGSSGYDYKCHVTNKKKLKPGGRTTFNMNFSSGTTTCSSSNDLLYNQDTLKLKHLKQCIAKGKLDCGKASL